jgi:peptidoglycan/LPS O-acetylase OafA/YrhL
MLKPLTSLRFFAAAAVVFAHFGYVFHTGGIGVAFFFMLSGFVLSLNYGSRFTSFNAHSFSRLYFLRLARIYPLHVATMLMSLPLWIMRREIPSWDDTLANLTLAQSWYPIGSRIFAFNGVAWTLSVEWFFYLSLPFIILLMHRMGLSKTKIRCLGVAIGAFLLSYAAHRMMNHGVTNYTAMWWLLNISPMLHICTFVIGIGLGQWFALSSRSFSWTMISPTLLEVAALIVIAAVYAIYLHWGVNFAGGFEICFLPAFALLIITFARSSGLISRALSLPLFVRLGEISFSIYMIHQIVILFFNEHIVMLMGFAANPLAQLSVAMLVLLLSEVAFRFVEEPARKWAKHFIARTSAQNTESLPHIAG